MSCGVYVVFCARARARAKARVGGVGDDRDVAVVEAWCKRVAGIGDVWLMELL